MGIQGDRVGQLHLIRSDRGDGVTRLAVAGDIDMCTGDAFRQAVARNLREPRLRALLLDVGAVTFIDSNGVAVLVGAHRVAGERGIPFALVNAGMRLRSVLELMGVYELLTGDRRLP